MNQTSRIIYSSSSAHLINELNFQLKFDSFGSWTKFNELIVEPSFELCSSWLGSLSALIIRESTKGSFLTIPLMRSHYPRCLQMFPNERESLTKGTQPRSSLLWFPKFLSLEALWKKWRMKPYIHLRSRGIMPLWLSWSLI